MPLTCATIRANQESSDLLWVSDVFDTREECSEWIKPFPRPSIDASDDALQPYVGVFRLELFSPRRRVYHHRSEAGTNYCQESSGLVETFWPAALVPIVANERGCSVRLPHCRFPPMCFLYR